MVVDGGRAFTSPGTTIHLEAGPALGGWDDSPKEGDWVFLWLLLHKRRQGTSLVLSSNHLQPAFISRCFRPVSRWWLVGFFPIGAMGTMQDRVFRFQRPCPVPDISDGLVQLLTPGTRIREVVELMLVDRSGHGASVFDGDLVEVPRDRMGPLHTPSNGIGGGPPMVSQGTLVAVEGRVYCVLDLAGSKRAQVELYLLGVHL